MHSALPHVVSSLVIVVGAAALTALVLQALRVPVVLGYVFVGLLIGPHGTGLVTDTMLIGTLSELGIILLFFTIGLEFSVRTIARVGLPTLLTVVMELSLIATVIFGVGRSFGWSTTESLFVALGVAIASTMLVVKGLEGHEVEPSAKELVLAILVVEDLVSILLLAVLSGVASGKGLSAGELAGMVGKLGGFLIGMIAIGMLVVPRGIRFVARSKRSDTLIVVSLAVCFAFVWIALKAGYSVALGAFVAGSLVAESGKGHDVDQLVRPLRDTFAAVFFVSIGMTIVPHDVLEHWPATVALAFALIAVKTVGITVAAVLTGNGLRRSLQAGLILPQIGELAFIAVSIGIAAGSNVARSFLLPVVVGASCITAITGALLTKYAAQIATAVDHKLPKSIATFVCFYESWINRMHDLNLAARRFRRPVQGTIVDASLLVAVVIGAALLRPRIVARLAPYGIDERVASTMLVAGAAAVGAVFAVAIARHAIRLARLLSRDVIPMPQPERDLGRAPRRALEIALEVAILLIVGLPIAAITQPFVPGGGLLVLAVLAAVVVGARHSLTELDHHVRAGAELIVELLARQGSEPPQLTEVSALLPGLSAVPVVLEAGGPAVGRSLAELDLRARTGASILAITRGGQAVHPSPTEPLHAGDVLALTGSEDAIHAARELLLGERRSLVAVLSSG